MEAQKAKKRDSIERGDNMCVCVRKKKKRERKRELEVRGIEE